MIRLSNVYGLNINWGSYRSSIIDYTFSMPNGMTRNVILSSCLRGLCCRKSIEISGMPVTSCINSKWISIPSHSLSGEMRLWTISGPIILFLLLWVFPLTPGFGQDINLSKSEVRELFHRLLIDTLNVQTGDMVLFKSKHLASRLTQFGTFSPFSHCGMVIRDEMDNLWITHATDNVYEDYQIPVKEEQAPRGGVILTRLEDSFSRMGITERSSFTSSMIFIFHDQQKKKFYRFTRNTRIIRLKSRHSGSLLHHWIWLYSTMIYYPFPSTNRSFALNIRSTCYQSSDS